MLGPIGPTELVIILVIVMIFFGVGKLPDVGGALGRGIREYKKASSGAYDDDKPAATETKADNGA